VQPAPLRGLGALAVPEQAVGVTGLAPAALHSPPHSDGDGLPPGELVWRYRGACPGRMMAPSRRCQGVKCPCTGAGARVRGALERGGPRLRAGRTLERGRAYSRGSGSSSEAEPARGRMHPLERDGARPREACIVERGGACSRGSLRGPPWWAAEVPAVWVVPCMVRQSVLGFVVGFKWGFPSC
jgi:hypothetical protein